MNSTKSSIYTSHWFYFFLLFFTYSVYDYFEHINRVGQIFGEYPIKWALFTFSSTLTLGGVSFFCSIGLQKLKLPELPSSTLSVALAAAIHLSFTGPLWDQLFWFDELYFSQIMVPATVAAIIYLGFRLLFYLVIIRLLKVT